MIKSCKISEIDKNFCFSGIYKIINTVNYKVYIGQSQNIYHRFLDYKKMRFNTYMNNAVNKYGINNFDVYILEKDVLHECLNEREQYWMDYYKSYDVDYGYNIAKIAGTNRGVKKSDKERESIYLSFK